MRLVPIAVFGLWSRCDCVGAMRACCCSLVQLRQGCLRASASLGSFSQLCVACFVAMAVASFMSPHVSVAFGAVVHVLALRAHVLQPRGAELGGKRSIGQAAVADMKGAFAGYQERDDWIERARQSAVLASCAASTASVCSGLRCWVAFAQTVLLKPKGKEFPPSVAELMAWSNLFRCARFVPPFLRESSFLLRACFQVIWELSRICQNRLHVPAGVI